MSYFLYIVDGYVVSFGQSEKPINTEITKEEYNRIKDVINNAPSAPTGFSYKLKADTLTWELVELPPIDDTDDEATESDYITALQDLGVDIET